MTGYVRSLFAVAFGSVLLAGLCAVALAEDAPPRCDPMPVVDVPTCELPTCAKTMKEVEDILTELQNSVRPEETLIVFDIDNTLLKMKKDLGSDAWYNWQKVLWKASAPDSDFAVADNIDDLLKIQRLLYDVGKMEPPEPGKTPNFVAWLRSAGYRVMMLTGRGPGALSATLRELIDNDYIPKDAPPCGAPACGEVLCSQPGIISMVAIRKASETAEICFPDSQLESLSQPIIYANGVLMAAGQNKGKILKLLLASTMEGCKGDYATKGRYKAIVLVDDDEKNTTNMQNAFANSDMKGRVTALRYGYLDCDVGNFKFKESRRQDDTNKSWCALKHTICSEESGFCSERPSCP